MPKKANQKATGYRNRQSEIMEKKRADERNISAFEIHPPRSERCRNKGEKDMKYFGTHYFPLVFPGALFDDQVEQMDEIQAAIIAGDDKAIAAMRGGGKTSICRVAIIWAVVYGISKYAVLFGATGPDGANNLGWIRDQFEINEIFAADFPEVCIPIAALQGSSRRAIGQTIEGQRSRIEWKPNKIVMPTMPEGVAEWCRCNGSIIECRSVDGACRGLNTHGLRPDLALMDDLESRDSVKSDGKTTDIMLKVETDIKGLAGQNKRLARLYVGTIMDENSVTFELTDKTQTPSFNGRRYQYVKKFPERDDLWDEYVKILQDTILGGPDKAKAFYKKNREAMDKGAVVAWPEGFDKRRYSSALEQYNGAKADSRLGLVYVACELQNDPSMLDSDADARITPKVVLGLINTLKRRQIPTECTVLTGFIDVHHAVKNGHLEWGITALQQGGTGYLIDYGKWPKRKTVGESYTGSAEAKVRQALMDLEKHIDSLDFVRDDGVEMTPTIGVDSGAGQHQLAVFSFCRQAPHRNYIPTKGENVGRRDYATIGKKSKVRGDHWRESIEAGASFKIPVVMFDANYWKTYIQNRIFTPEGGDGRLTIFGRHKAEHVELAKHWSAEVKKVIIDKASGTEYDQWDLPPAKVNHQFDVIVGSFMLGCVKGISLPGMAGRGGRRKRRRRRKQEDTK